MCFFDKNVSIEPQFYDYSLYPTEAILQRHLQCDIFEVLGNNYLLVITGL